MATSTRNLELPAVASRLRLAIARTARRLRQEAAEAESGPALSPTLTAALATIEAHGPLTPSELASRERIKRPTATRIVAKLDDLDLITRAADPSDGRACLVATTGAGRARLKRLRSRKNAFLARRMRDLSAPEIATLERASEILERLLADEGRR